MKNNLLFKGPQNPVTFTFYYSRLRGDFSQPIVKLFISPSLAIYYSFSENIYTGSNTADTFVFMNNNKLKGGTGHRNIVTYLISIKINIKFMLTFINIFLSPNCLKRTVVQNINCESVSLEFLRGLYNFYLSKKNLKQLFLVENCKIKIFYTGESILIIIF